MREAFIVDGLRTPIGKRGGSLKGIHAVDLLGLVIENIVNRNSIDPSCVDDVIAGCVSQLGEQTGNVCLLYTSPSPRDRVLSRMPSSA